MSIHRAAERYETRQPGIVSWHCFSAGAHYDPDNLSFGPLLGVDEHVLDAGAEFAEHAHQGVEIISWIAEGTLHHRSADVDQDVNAGESLIQDAAAGIRHAEGNAADEPLRLIQTTLVAEAGVTFTVARAATQIQAPWVHLFVVDGSWQLDDDSLEPGDSARLTDDAMHSLDGAGVVLVLSQPPLVV